MLKTTFEYLLSTVGFVVVLVSLAWAVVNHKKSVCFFNEEVLANSACAFSRCGRLQCIGATAVFTKPVDKVWLDLRLLRTNASQESVIFKYRQNLCNLTAINKDNYFGSSLMRLMSRYLKPLKCPMYANITVPQFPLMLHFTEAFYPPGDYILYFSTYNENYTVAGVNVSFAIVNKRKY